MASDQSSAKDKCQRPLRAVLGDAAYCNFCGAKRGEPCPMSAEALEMLLDDLAVAEELDEV